MLEVHQGDQQEVEVHRMDLVEVIIVNPHHQEEATMVTMAIEEMFIQVHQVV